MDPCFAINTISDYISLIVYRVAQPTTSTGCSDSVENDSHDSDFDDPDFQVFCRKNPRQEEYVEFQIKRVKTTHIYCTVCESKQQLTIVPLNARLQAFIKRKIFIPKRNRCCPNHLIKKPFFEDDLPLLRVYSNHSFLEKGEVLQFLNLLANNVGLTLHNRVLHTEILCF